MTTVPDAAVATGGFGMMTVVVVVVVVLPGVTTVVAPGVEATVAVEVVAPATPGVVVVVVVERITVPSSLVYVVAVPPGMAVVVPLTGWPLTYVVLLVFWPLLLDVMLVAVVPESVLLTVVVSEPDEYVLLVVVRCFELAHASMNISNAAAALGAASRFQSNLSMTISCC
jgi:hypothetical protein